MLHPALHRFVAWRGPDESASVLIASVAAWSSASLPELLLISISFDLALIVDQHAQKYSAFVALTPGAIRVSWARRFAIARLSDRRCRLRMNPFLYHCRRPNQCRASPKLPPAGYLRQEHCRLP